MPFFPFHRGLPLTYLDLKWSLFYQLAGFDGRRKLELLLNFEFRSTKKLRPMETGAFYSSYPMASNASQGSLMENVATVSLTMLGLARPG
jgi:hypothetical protein